MLHLSLIIPLQLPLSFFPKILSEDGCSSSTPSSLSFLKIDFCSGDEDYLLITSWGEPPPLFLFLHPPEGGMDEAQTRFETV